MLEAVLHFWFGDAADAPEIARRQQRLWWGKDPVLDATIRDRFAPLLAAEQRGEFAGETAPRALLARIVLLDQLPRNMFRGSADAFGYDARALALSRQLLANDGDRMLQPIERVFAYLPFEHAEQLADQDRAVTLFTSAAGGGAGGRTRAVHRLPRVCRKAPADHCPLWPVSAPQCRAWPRVKHRRTTIFAATRFVILNRVLSQDAFMLTRNTIKLIKSLQQKKFRREHGLFVVEGGKSVQEALASDWPVHTVYCTESYLPELERALRRRHIEPVLAKAAELAEMGSYEQNDTALAVLAVPAPTPLRLSESEYALVLDDIRDPGNLGTILRTADWYGIRQIVCSPETAELYNPKVIAASMGSFLRVQLHYTALPAFLLSQRARPIYGAFLDGANLHQLQFAAAGGLLVVGNEANGISADVAAHVSQRLTIPRFGQAESLNAGIATAIVLDNWARQRS